MWRSSSARVALTSTSEPEILVVDASVLVEAVVGGRHARGAEALMSAYDAAYAAAAEHLRAPADHR